MGWLAETPYRQSLLWDSLTGLSCFLFSEVDGISDCAPQSGKATGWTLLLCGAAGWALQLPLVRHV